MNYQYAIEINNLCKIFKGFTLENISFSIPKGTIMGFVGQNGAGKSTTIKAVLNIIKNDGGTISVFGMDHIINEKKIKQNISAVFDENPFNDTLNAKEINAIMRRIYSKWEPHTFMNYLERFGLPINKAIGDFSKGMKMKLQIAAALSHNAELLIMDEPTSGLDPVVRNEILDVFEEYVRDGNHTIFLSSHITSDLERVAHSITYIHNGRLLLTDTKENILFNHGIIKCSVEEVRQIPNDNMVSIKVTDNTAHVMINNRNNPVYDGYTFSPVSLDDVLLFYVGAQSHHRWDEGRSL